MLLPDPGGTSTTKMRASAVFDTPSVFAAHDKPEQDIPEISTPLQLSLSQCLPQLPVLGDELAELLPLGFKVGAILLCLMRF